MVEVLPAKFLITESVEDVEVDIFAISSPNVIITQSEARATETDLAISRLIAQEIVAAAETLIVLSGIHLSREGIAALEASSPEHGASSDSAGGATAISLAGIPAEGRRGEQAGISVHPPDVAAPTRPLRGRYLLKITGNGVYTTLAGRTKGWCKELLMEVMCNAIAGAVFQTGTAEPTMSDQLNSRVSLSASLVDSETGEVVWSSLVVDESYESDNTSSDFRNPFVVYATCQRLLEPLLGVSKMEAKSYRPRYLKD
jgi:hypothetical protein